MIIMEVEVFDKEYIYESPDDSDEDIREVRRQYKPATMFLDNDFIIEKDGEEQIILYSNNHQFVVKGNYSIFMKRIKDSLENSYYVE